MAEIWLLPRKRKFGRKVVSKRKFGELKLPDLVDQDLYNIVVVDGGVKTLPLPDSDLNRAHSVSISGSGFSSSAVYGGVKALASPDLDIERSGSKFGFPSNSSGVNPLERAITDCIYDNCVICGGSKWPGLSDSDSDLEGSCSKSGSGGLNGGGDYDIEMKMRIGLKLNNNRNEEEDLFEVWDDKFHENVLGYYDNCRDRIEPKDRPMWDRYYKEIRDSDGYDITYYPGPVPLAPIRPLEGFKDRPSVLEIVTELTNAAINEINKIRKEDDDEFEVHDILTVTVRAGMISWYYITFEAKKKKKKQKDLQSPHIHISAQEEYDQHGGAPLITTFQTRVAKSFYNDEVKVEECRIKGVKTSVLTTNPAQGWIL